jgi:hypothetical protein
MMFFKKYRFNHVFLNQKEKKNHCVSLSPASSPTPSAEAPGVTTPSVDDLSTEPAAAPTGKSAASALLPISALSLLVFLLSVGL